MRVLFTRCKITTKRCIRYAKFNEISSPPSSFYQPNKVFGSAEFNEEINYPFQETKRALSLHIKPSHMPWLPEANEPLNLTKS